MHNPRAGSKELHSVFRPDRGDLDGPPAKLLLTVNELYRLLGMSPRSIHERTRRREIPCYRLGTALPFDLEENRQWMINFRAEHSTRGGAEMRGA